MPVISKSRYAPIHLERKDPQAKVAYALDWSEWLVPPDTISTVTVTPTGVSLLGSATVVGSETRFTLGGGTAGTIATIHVKVTSSTGLEDERTCTLEILER